LKRQDLPLLKERVPLKATRADQSEPVCFPSNHFLRSVTGDENPGVSV
jgi:hypothetical protein